MPLAAAAFQGAVQHLSLPVQFNHLWCCWISATPEQRLAETGEVAACERHEAVNCHAQDVAPAAHHTTGNQFKQDLKPQQAVVFFLSSRLSCQSYPVPSAVLHCAGTHASHASAHPDFLGQVSHRRETRRSLSHRRRCCGDASPLQPQACEVRGCHRHNHEMPASKVGARRAQAPTLYTTPPPVHDFPPSSQSHRSTMYSDATRPDSSFHPSTFTQHPTFPPPVTPLCKFTDFCTPQARHFSCQVSDVNMKSVTI